MNPLAFMTTWLLGAASAGDREARAGLSLLWPALIMDMDWNLEMIRSGVVNNKPNDIADGLQRMLGGFAKENGETCTKTIVRAIKVQSGEYAARVVATAAMTLPREKLVATLRDMLAALDAATPASAK